MLFTKLVTCSELTMVNIQANMDVFCTTANKPKTQVRPNRGSSTKVLFTIVL